MESRFLEERFETFAQCSGAGRTSHPETWSAIRKNVQRFSEKIVLYQKS